MSFKRLALSLFVGATCLSAIAVPAKPGIRTVTQADGTTLSVRLVGDEFFHTYTTVDGLAVTRQADGNYYYRTAEGVSSVVAHDLESRSAEEKSFVAGNAHGMTAKALASRLGTVRKARRASAQPRKAS
ncbi:MAG: hypothetical protein K2L75_05845, partial [Muribaculaceae bacterium]|nr:hypothetical protein [Muribaculaceae bacterium]